MDRRACLLKPEDETEKPETDQNRRADPRERQPADEPVNAVDGAVGIRPAGDIPDDQAAQQERQTREGIASGADRTELLVKRRRLLPEEAVHAQRASEPGKPLERECAGALEVLDEDLLHGAAAVHELVQGHVGGLEPRITAPAPGPVWGLQHGV